MARIIIVDDDEIVTDIVVEMLADAGHMASAVHDGEEAIAAIRDGAPDLVVLDYALPGRTGMDILRAVRERHRACAMPVLMLTARQGRLHADRARHEGVDDYMTKPFDPHALVDRIERLLADAATRRAREAA